MISWIKRLLPGKCEKKQDNCKCWEHGRNILQVEEGDRITTTKTCTNCGARQGVRIEGVKE